MASFKSQGKKARPAEAIYYRDYIVSELWEDRKRRYFERHAHACYICGSTTVVQLNHIKYGNYGNESDRDLVALCRDHHAQLHKELGVRGNMHRQTEHFLEAQIAKYNSENEDPVPVPAAPDKEKESIFSHIRSLMKNK